MPRLEVRLLGGYRVDLDGARADGFETDKARALLAYLILEADRPHRRETLASLLWPDRPDSVARANLRQTLARLRRVLRDAPEGHFLFVTPNDVQFNTASDYLLDVAELEKYGRLPARHTQLLPPALCCDFLAGFAVPDSEAFQAWVLNKQEYCHRMVIEILEEQNSYWEGIGDYDRAVTAARLLIQLEPWLEEAYRRCMRDLALAGRRDEALHQYDLCRRALQAELGVEPGSSTCALYEDIRDGTPVLAGVTARPVRSEGTRAPAPPFVAREAEFGRLRQHLDAALRGDPQIVLVGGDAGSGKSALLESFAAAAMADYPDLVVAGVRCYPGDRADPYAPLRRLGHMLFGDLDSGSSWWIPGCDHVSRLRRVSHVALAALAENGFDLMHSFFSAPSLLRRYAALAADTATAQKTPEWHSALVAAARPCDPQLPGRSLPANHDNLQDQLTCALTALSRRHPLLLIFDDLHWVDESTASFLFRLSRDLSGCRLLSLGAYRPASIVTGRSAGHSAEPLRHPLARTINELRLRAGEIIIDLDRADGRALVDALIDLEPNRLGARFRDALLAQTSGHALFTVETLRNLQERGELVKDGAGRWVANDNLDWGALPVRVEAAIAERLDRLPTDYYRILSIASVEGDEFSAEVVAELTQSPVYDVVARVGAIGQEHRLVLPRAIKAAHGGTHHVYRFSHHLFRKYLYDQLDPVQRGELHRQVAAALVRQVAGDAVEREGISAQLAWHYESAGMGLEAAQASYQAGRQAMRLSAFREAIRHFEHGLALLEAVPPAPERAHLEKELVLGLLSPQRVLEGWGTDGYRGSLARARRINTSETNGPAELRLAEAEIERLLAQGYHEEALALVDRACALAEEVGDRAMLPALLLHAGVAHCLLGHFQTGMPLLEHLSASQTVERSGELRQWKGVDVSGMAMSWSGLALWVTGYGERGLARCREAVSTAEERNDPLGLAFALAFGIILHFFNGERSSEVGLQVERLHRLAVEHGFGWWRVYAEILAGRLMIDRGEIIAGIQKMQAAGATWQGSGMGMGVPVLATLIADGCLRARKGLAPGQQEAAGHLLAVGHASLGMVSQLPGLRAGWLAPEFKRLRGELLLARDGKAAAPEALSCFRMAVQLAQQHGTLALELRAALSLVRLLATERGGHKTDLDEAQDHLRVVCGMFTEGRSSSDLLDAAILLRAADHSNGRDQSKNRQRSAERSLPEPA